MANGYYEIKKAVEYMFTLKAGNHEVILTSQGYDVKASAEKGIAAVQKYGLDDARYELKEATNEQAYFVLKASNGHIIGTSQMYSSEAARNKGIDAVKANAATQIIKDIC